MNLRVSNPDAQTAPTLSGQLRLALSESQTLYNSFGVTQTKHEQYSPSFKPENYSGSAEHKHYLGLRIIPHGCIYENKHVAKLQDNQPSLRGSVHPFGSIPRRFNSCLANSLNQLLSVMLSVPAASFSCSRNSGCMRIWNAGDCPPDFGVRSFTLDIVHTFSFNGFHKVCTLYHEYLPKKTPPKGITSTRRGLTTNDSQRIEAAMKDHTQTHHKFTWRFLALSANTRNVIHITATTEREARDQSPVGCVMVFAGRLPAQEVCHA